MSRIGIIRDGKSERVTPELALKLVQRGKAVVDTDDGRGFAAWERFVINRGGSNPVGIPTIDLPEGWEVIKKGAWWTVFHHGVKVGKAQKTEGAALRMVPMEPAATGEEGED